MMRQLVVVGILAAAGAVVSAQTVELSLLGAGSDPAGLYGSTVEVNGGRAVRWTLKTQVVSPFAGLGLSFIAADLDGGTGNPGSIVFEQGTAGAAFSSFEPPNGFARLNTDDTSAFGGDVQPCGLHDIGGGLNTMGYAPAMGEPATDTRFGQAFDLVNTVPTNTGVNTWTTVASGVFTVPDITGTYTVRIGRAGATVLASAPILDNAATVRRVDPVLVDEILTINVDYCLADLAGGDPPDYGGDGLLDLNDINAFVTGFMALDPLTADMNDDGIFDLSDITIFVTAFVNGCGEIEGHPLTEEEQAVLEQLAQQMVMAGSGGLSAASMTSIDVSKVDTIEPIGVVTAADIAAYIQRFAARAVDADLTANTTVDVEDAEALLDAVENADPVELP